MDTGAETSVERPTLPSPAFPRSGLVGALRFSVICKHAFLTALQHDCFNLAQSIAYSAMLALFPALVVAAAVIALLPDSAPLRLQLGTFFDRVLPSDVTPLLTSYFATSPGASRAAHSLRALALAAVFSLTGASSVMATLMEGLRRANRLPANCWTFAQLRIRAFLLVPLSLLPLILASILVVFGHLVTVWVAVHAPEMVRMPLYLAATLLRWLVALAGVVGINGLLYLKGSPMRQPWHRVLPGAGVSTAMWFVATISFGWYVTRFANYSRIYGSLGAGIALLIWLYLTFFSVLCGAEFNSELQQRAQPPNS